MNLEAKHVMNGREPRRNKQVSSTLECAPQEALKRLDAARAMEAELVCADVLMLVASLRGTVGGLTTELLEDHIRHYIVGPAHEKDPEKAKGAADLIGVVRTYLK